MLRILGELSSFWRDLDFLKNFAYRFYDLNYGWYSNVNNLIKDENVAGVRKIKIIYGLSSVSL